MSNEETPGQYSKAQLSDCKCVTPHGSAVLQQSKWDDDSQQYLLLETCYAISHLGVHCVQPNILLLQEGLTPL